MVCFGDAWPAGTRFKCSSGDVSMFFVLGCLRRVRSVHLYFYLIKKGAVRIFQGAFSDAGWFLWKSDPALAAPTQTCTRRPEPKRTYEDSKVQTSKVLLPLCHQWRRRVSVNKHGRTQTPLQTLPVSSHHQQPPPLINNSRAPCLRHPDYCECIWRVDWTRFKVSWLDFFVSCTSIRKLLSQVHDN